MTNNISCKFILRLNLKKKNGLVPVYMRVILNRKNTVYSLNIDVNPKFWDTIKFRLKTSHMDAAKTNLLLDNYYNKANDLIFQSRINNKPLTFESFKRDFFGQNVSKNFFEFVNSELKANENVFSSETTRCFKGQNTKLQRFAPQLVFSDIDYAFILKYENHMRNKLNNHTNTIDKSLRFIRNFMNRAVMQGYITETPFNKYKIKTLPAVRRQFLTIEELEKIENGKWRLTNKSLDRFVRYFLFCCYTGIRFRDIANLRYQSIKENNMLEIRMHKTKKIVRIPLISKAVKLIPDPEKHLPAERIFKVATNQVCNRFLIDVMKLAEINKNISFHCSRHTFATNALNLGISLDVVSELLGTTIKVAKIYSKMLDNIKIEEMKKFET